jgi:membrane-associated phospholipid phosphatase
VFRHDLNFEERLLLLARTRAHTPAAERAVVGFSRLGEHAAIWLAIGLAGGLADRPRRREWARARRAVLLTYAVNTAIKFSVRRRRPALPGLPPLMGTTTGLSFPSAHAATSFAAALAYRRCGLPGGPLYGLAGAMAASRVYLGVHYPSDILAGALLGSSIAALATGAASASGLADAAGLANGSGELAPRRRTVEDTGG